MTEIATQTAARLPVPQLVRQSGADAVLRPDGEWTRALVQEMALLDLRKMRMDVQIVPCDGGFTLTGHLGATVVQPCVVTLAPVTTRIEAPVLRSYQRELPEPEGDEAEMPEDDSLEPLGAVIDLGAVLAEALALNLPDYPRAEGAELDGLAVDPDDADSLSQETRKPFAGLQGLKDKLSDGED